MYVQIFWPFTPQIRAHNPLLPDNSDEHYVDLMGKAEKSIFLNSHYVFASVSCAYGVYGLRACGLSPFRVDCQTSAPFVSDVGPFSAFFL